MKLVNLLIAVVLALVVSANYSIGQTKLNAFGSLGTSGIGVGLKYKNTTLYTKYFYEYFEFDGGFVYEHNPTIGLVQNLINEDQVKLYTGLEYRTKLYEQKYSFPGTFNSTNFFVSVPLGVEIAPFKKYKNLSIVLETGLEFEHYLYRYKGYSWNLNLWRGLIEIRYQFGKRIKVK